MRSLARALSLGAKREAEEEEEEEEEVDGRKNTVNRG